jgi:hypothetical protein
MRVDKEPVSSVHAAGWNAVDDLPETRKGGSGNACPPNEKKPYRKPTYRFEKVFETMALACGKVNPVMRTCTFNRHNS